jgi:hypothetical protein
LAQPLQARDDGVADVKERNPDARCATTAATSLTPHLEPARHEEVGDPREHRERNSSRPQRRAQSAASKRVVAPPAR